MTAAVNARSGRRLWRGAIVLVAALCGSLFAALPSAHAAPGCPANNFCLYGDIRYAGRYVFLTMGSSNLDRDFNGFGDEASSLVNNTNYDWCVFRSNDYILGSKKYHPGERIDYVGPELNDKISSAHRITRILYDC